MNQTEQIEKELRYGKINPYIGPTQFQLLSGQQIITLAASGCICFILGFSIGWFMAAFLWLGIFVLTVLALGKDYSRIFARMSKQRRYYSDRPNYQVKAGIPLMVIELPEPFKLSQLFRRQTKQKTLKKIEPEFDLRAYGEMLLGEDIGFYLVHQDKQDRAMVIFGFTLQGIDPTLSEQEAMDWLQAIVMALQKIPGIELKFFWDVEGSADQVLLHQHDLVTHHDLDPLSEKLIKSEAQVAVDLAADGKLVHSVIRVYAKYRLSLADDYAVKEDRLDKLLAHTQPLVGTFQEYLNPQPEGFSSKQAWEKVLDRAYQAGYIPTAKALTQMGVKPQPMTKEDLWAIDWEDTHAEPADPCPQSITYSEAGLSPFSENQPLPYHILGELFSPERGLPAVPTPYLYTLYHPIKNQWAALVKINQLSTYNKIDNFLSIGYMKFLLQALEGFHGYRLISEITQIEPDSRLKLVNSAIKERNRKAIDAQLLHSTRNVQAEADVNELVDASRELSSGRWPLKVSLGIWVYRKDKASLTAAVQDLIRRLPTSKTEQVSNHLMTHWISSHPFHWQSLFSKPQLRREEYQCNQGVPLMPLVHPQTIDQQGIPFVSRGVAIPVHLNTALKKNLIAIFGPMGVGKSVLMNRMILENIIHRIFTVVIDVPPGNGKSTYQPFMIQLQRIGVSAAYFDVKSHIINGLDEIDTSWAGDLLSVQLLKKIKQNHLSLLRALVLGDDLDHPLYKTIKSVLALSYQDWRALADIDQRYRIAKAAAFGSEDSKRMPILQDFVDYFPQWVKQYKQDKDCEDLELQAIAMIRTELEAVLTTDLGASINGINTFNFDLQTLVIGLTDLQDPQESVIYSMAAINLMELQSFRYPRSAIFGDEISTTFKYRSISIRFAETCTRGRKEAKNVVIAGTEENTLVQSEGGRDILSNLDAVFYGHCNPTAVENAAKHLRLKPEILSKYVRAEYAPNLAELCTSWYLRKGNQHYELLFYTSALMIALVCTQPEETAARDRILALYPDNPLQGYIKFGHLLKRAYKLNLPLSLIGA
ncbi:ATP-binding protein [Acaryochloris marina]|uniref:Uncharacterized protein n=1 Tax=Acaryochloris marina (strain MBIC 11017) TaxID=329726 RepID=A8ZQF3_ACAM1|nr:hypothetical protein [Acaryochloris marina]ABW33239.1 hypothetical protein AM1_G0059 [Acaryochloris marina MBIC11017]